MKNLPTVIDGIESYFTKVNSFPILTKEEEIELATRYKETEDLEAAHKMVLSHLRVVVFVARGYSGYGLPQEDLIQEGNIGLMKAVKRYDPKYGVRLVSYALHWIRAEIHDFVVNNWRLVKIATTKPQRKLFFNLRKMRKTLDPLRPEEIADIAKHLNVSEQEVVSMEARFANHEISMDLERDEDETSGLVMDFIPADRQYEPMNVIESSEQNEAVENALNDLDPRSRRIVETRWLCDAGKEATLQDLSLEFKVSKERIRQIEKKAIEKIQEEVEV